MGNILEEFRLWLGFIESKIRKLSNNFEWQKIDETRNYVDILDFHLFPQCFFKQDKEFAFSRAFFYGLRLKREYASEFLGFKFEYFSVPITRFLNHISEEAFKEDKGGFKQGAKINLRVFKVKRSEIEEIGYIKEEDFPINNATIILNNGNNNNNNNIVNNGNNGYNNTNGNINNNKNMNILKRGNIEEMPEFPLKKKVFKEEDKDKSTSIIPKTPINNNNKPEKTPENYLDSLFN